MQCGAQWPPPGTQPRVQYPTRTDILNRGSSVASKEELIQRGMLLNRWGLRRGRGWK